MDKPIIRHCANCKYSVKKQCWGETHYYCEVRYTKVYYPRARAVFCKYYKEYEENKNV